jgi:hypothetical protein
MADTGVSGGGEMKKRRNEEAEKRRSGEREKRRSGEAGDGENVPLLFLIGVLAD